MKPGRFLSAVAVAAALAIAAPLVASATAPTPVLKLYLIGGYTVGHKVVTVTGRGIHVEGFEHPYVPGQWVEVRAFLAGRQIHAGPLPLKPVSNATYGRFELRIASPGPGTVTVSARHRGTPALPGLTARSRYDILDPNVGFGSTGPAVRLIQARLSALHFFLPLTGVYDGGTGLAIDAYHRLLGWGTYQTLDSRTVKALLAGQGQFRVRYPGDGKHAEGDLTHQLLALINGSKVYWIFPISSGKPSTPTILGRFHVYSKVPGYLPDGMYYSNFFYTGFAVHGYNPAPDFPASHGCMRLPIVDAIPVYNWLQIGDGVDTYY